MKLFGPEALFVFLVSVVQLCRGKSALPSTVPIGAVFELGDDHLLTALQMAIDRINQGNMFAHTKLELLPFFIKPNDSFNSARLICQMLSERVWAIFSSRSESVGWYARSLAKDLHVPHISVFWDYRSKSMINVNHRTDRRKQGGTSTGQTNAKPIWWNRDALKGIGIPSGYARNGRQTPLSETLDQDGAGKLSEGETENWNAFVDQHEQNSLAANETFTISLYPDPNQLAKAYRDLIVSRGWKSFTLVYDHDNELIKMKDLLRIVGQSRSKRQIQISIVKFDQHFGRAKRDNDNGDEQQEGEEGEEDDEGDEGEAHHHQRLRKSTNTKSQEQQNQYTKLLKDLKKTEHNLVLALSHERVLNVLREARKMNRMTEYNNFLITSLDIHTMDLTEFKANAAANITGFSMLSPSGQPIDLGDEMILHRFLANAHRDREPRLNNPPKQTDWQYPVLTTTEALIYDAVTLFAQTLDDLDRKMPGEISQPFLACNATHTWPLGAHIVRHMRTLKIKAITGLLMFDPHGHRTNFTMDILQLKPSGLENIAKWTPEFGVKSNANYTFYDSYKQILEAMKTKELRVTVPTNSKPYVYLKDNHTEEQGNERFEGYCVDLLNNIAEVFRTEFASDFKFVIQMVSDGKYGRPNKESGEWDGMFGELMRHQVDLAIGDLTATYLRETAVDFTMPFMNLGIAILFKKASLPEPELFSFLKPFSHEVWLYLASAYLGMSLLLWILSRISPFEWVSPESCDPEPTELVTEFSLGNSLWFTIGSLMQQGSEIAPKALSTRLLASVWWLFTMIIIASYTANLAASLTLSLMSPSISNVQDLAKQTVIQYGCKRGGSTYEFFQSSNHSTFQRMFNTMESNKEVYINELDDAIERVRKGGYAYLAESSTIEFLIQRQCDLYQVGTWLDNKGYGIATPSDSPYRTPISNAIVVLQDRGVLYNLKKRWWVEKGGDKCVEGETKMSLDLDIANVGGVFLVLVAGAAIGVLCGILEFIWKSLKLSRDERQSVGKLIWYEIVRICTGGGSSRPVYTAPVARAKRDKSQEDDDDDEVDKKGSIKLQPLYSRENIPNEHAASLYSNVSPSSITPLLSKSLSRLASPQSFSTHHTTPF